MGQVLRRAISKAQPTSAAAPGAVPPPPPRSGPIGRGKFVDKERPINMVSPRGRPPLMDDPGMLDDIIRRDHMRAAAAGIQRPARRSPWAERGISVEDYAKEWHRSRSPVIISQPTNVASEAKPGYENVGQPGSKNVAYPGYENVSQPGSKNVAYPGYENVVHPGSESEAKPAPESRDWDRNHPTYKFMAQHLAKNIVNVNETKPLVDPGPKPERRVAARPKRQKIPGKLKLDELKQVFLLRYGAAEGEPKPLDAETIAQRFEVDAEQLKKMFRYMSLPTPVKVNPFNKEP